MASSTNNYVRLAEIPVPSAALFTAPDVVQLSFSVSDHVRNAKRTMSKSIVLSTGASTHLQDVNDVILSAFSPSKERHAVLRDSKTDGQSKRFVEVWVGCRSIVNVDVTDKHGAFYDDEYISSLFFSSSETCLVYVAEKRAETSDSHDPYARFRYTQDLGEGLNGKKNPIIYILNWTEGALANPKLCAVEPPPGLLLGQPIFSPNSDNILYATGYEHLCDGNLLGIKGCHNRPVGIWRLRFDMSAPDSDSTGNHLKVMIRKLTPAHLSARSPRILSFNQKVILVWLSQRTGGAHLGTSSLNSLDISNDQEDAEICHNDTKVIVDIVQKPGSDQFPGLYPSYNLLASPFLDHGDALSPSLVLTSTWKSRTTILAVSIPDGTITDLTPDIDEEHYSWSLLALDGKSQIISQRSSPSVPFKIMQGEYAINGKIFWKVIDSHCLDESLASKLSKLTTSIEPVPGQYPTETIIVRSISHTRTTPCICFTHGGPHGTSTTAFSASIAAFVLEGYNISLPNYTGSLGFGEAAVNALIGRCGELDVQDCIASVHHLISIGISSEGPGRQYIMGGSHGGFLAAHLIGRYPDMFSSAAIRNPVISCGEISNSDIPDWFYAEFGLAFPVSSSPLNATEPSITKERTSSPSLSIPPLMTTNTFAQLQAASPISCVDAIRSSVILHIGLADRRVAPAQGVGLYRSLKARAQCQVEMLAFEGQGHPLDGVETAKVVWASTRDWFARQRL